jgi:Lhr-like helicase
MIKRFVDFQSAKSLVELLTKIPNFKVNLTPQEKNVIGENGNVLVIGRSGTGKTTCAVLRLFSIEMLFKIRLSLYKRKFQEKL